ncbi:hypothetical protein I3843_06G142500 [Carya illinoinensis]|nr:hypothetical protein I3843_06G142500 [Carya illinoinensis]
MGSVQGRVRFESMRSKPINLRVSREEQNLERLQRCTNHSTSNNTNTNSDRDAQSLAVDGRGLNWKNQREMGSIDATAAEKSEQELRKEIDELLRQQRQITERLRDPRGLRRGVFSGAGPRNFASNGALQRSLIRPICTRPDISFAVGMLGRYQSNPGMTDAEDQPPGKRRLSSAVVKLEDEDITADAEAAKDLKKENAIREGVAGAGTANQSDRKPSNLKQTGWSRRDENQRAAKTESEGPVVKHVPRVLPKNEDPSLVTRNKRMLGRLLGTLEKFRKEDMQLSGTEAYMRRSNSLQMAEQRACEESERLRQQEREQIAEKRRRDLTLRARVTAKTEEKKLELLFLQTKAEPPIYYSPNKPLEEDETLVQQQKGQAFLEWKATRREELSLYQKQIQEQYVANVEKDLERWQNARKARKTK